MTAPLVQAKDLRVVRNGRLVLAVESFSLARGQTVAVMGPNGAGKSTFLLALSGLVPLAQGEVWFAGRRLQGRRDLSLRRRMALVLQTPLLLDASVFDNVALGLRYRHLPRQDVRQRALYWLKRLGVAHLARRRAHQLSGGEAQRVSLARAFALQPELLLLDEPFSALDAPSRQRLLAEVRALLAEERVSTILVTHQEEVARTLAGDALLWLEDGQLRPQPVRETAASGTI